MTQGLPSSEATPVRGERLPVCTSAMWRSNTGPLGVFFTKAVANWSTLRVASMPRTMYSLPYSYITPPAALAFMPRTACCTSVSETP